LRAEIDEVFAVSGDLAGAVEQVARLGAQQQIPPGSPMGAVLSGVGIARAAVNPANTGLNLIEGASKELWQQRTEIQRERNSTGQPPPSGDEGHVAGCNVDDGSCGLEGRASMSEQVLYEFPIQGATYYEWDGSSSRPV
jgi:hypothetical protein